MKRKYILLLPILMLNPAIADSSSNHDWRKTATYEEKVDNMVEVLPGASNLMLQMGMRYQNLYWAAKQRKWDFAEYQAEEMQDLIETLQVTRPARAETAQVFLDNMYPRIIEATAAKDWNTFQKAYAIFMTPACNATLPTTTGLLSFPMSHAGLLHRC